MSKIELSANQRAVLELAVSTGGRLEQYPGNLQGGARTSVVRGLLRIGLVEPHVDGMHLTPAGYEQVGATPPAAAEEGGGHDDEGPADDDQGDDADVAAPTDSDSAGPDGADGGAGNGDVEPATATAVAKPERANRGESKQSVVVGLLMRPEGATIAQIMAATQWQQHSVRGFLAGTVKKKGYQVISTKEGKGERVYRIKPEEAEAAPDTVARDEEG